MTVEQLNNIWYGIVSDHYEISRKAWLAMRELDEMPDDEVEYLSTLIDTAIAMINK